MRRNFQNYPPGVYDNWHHSPQAYNQRSHSGRYCPQQWQIPPAPTFFNDFTEAYRPRGSRAVSWKQKGQTTANSTSQISHSPKQLKRPTSPEISDPMKRQKLSESTKLCAPLQTSDLSEPLELVLPFLSELESIKEVGLTELPDLSKPAEPPKSLKPAEPPKMLTLAESPKILTLAESSKMSTDAQPPKVLTSAVLPKTLEPAGSSERSKLAESPNTLQSSGNTALRQPPSLPMMPSTSSQTAVSPGTQPVEVVLTPAVKAYIREVVREMIPQVPTGTVDTVAQVDINRQISRRGGRGNRGYNGRWVHKHYHKKNQVSVYHMYFS